MFDFYSHFLFLPQTRVLYYCFTGLRDFLTWKGNKLIPEHTSYLQLRQFYPKRLTVNKDAHHYVVRAEVWHLPQRLTGGIEPQLDLWNRGGSTPVPFKRGADHPSFSLTTTLPHKAVHSGMTSCVHNTLPLPPHRMTRVSRRHQRVPGPDRTLPSGPGLHQQPGLLHLPEDLRQLRPGLPPERGGHALRGYGRRLALLRTSAVKQFK